MGAYIKLDFERDTWNWKHIETYLKKAGNTVDPVEGVPYLWVQDVLEQIQEQTKAPRIAEPEWGSVVTAHTAYNPERSEWVRWLDEKKQGDDSLSWKRRDGGTATWSSLLDPEPV